MRDAGFVLPWILRRSAGALRHRWILLDGQPQKRRRALYPLDGDGNILATHEKPRINTSMGKCPVRRHEGGAIYD